MKRKQNDAASFKATTTMIWPREAVAKRTVPSLASDYCSDSGRQGKGSIENAGRRKVDGLRGDCWIKFHLALRYIITPSIYARMTTLVRWRRFITTHNTKDNDKHEMRLREQFSVDIVSTREEVNWQAHLVAREKDNKICLTGEALRAMRLFISIGVWYEWTFLKYLPVIVCKKRSRQW